ncbi:MAG: suppressor of fused domain protein [Acidimicrobiales bacterium]
MSGRGAKLIDHQVDAADGGPAAHRYRPQAPHRFRGEGPLDEVTTHRAGVPEHWHLVTYGLTELAVKESDDPEVSGWGFELTFRLAGEHDEEPLWAVDLLTNLAAYVWTTRHPFAAGHHLDLGGPIRLGHDTAITAAVVVADPALGRVMGPFGAVEFLQVVGITADELELCRSWSTDAVVQLLQRRDPLLVTDLGRSSSLADPVVRAEIEARAPAEGSSLTELRVATLAWQRRVGRGLTIRLGAGASAALGPALRRELVGAGARFSVVGDHGELRFTVAADPFWRRAGDDVEIDVPLGAVGQLAELFDGRPGWGRRPDWAGLRFQVVP